jgi:hypothetical protein
MTTLPFLQQRRGRRSKCIISGKTQGETQKFRDPKNIVELRRNDPQQEHQSEVVVPLSSQVNHVPRSNPRQSTVEGAEKIEGIVFRWKRRALALRKIFESGFSPGLFSMRPLFPHLFSHQWNLSTPK